MVVDNQTGYLHCVRWQSKNQLRLAVHQLLGFSSTTWRKNIARESDAYHCKSENLCSQGNNSLSGGCSMNPTSVETLGGQPCFDGAFGWEEWGITWRVDRPLRGKTRLLLQSGNCPLASQHPNHLAKQGNSLDATAKWRKNSAKKQTKKAAGTLEAIYDVQTSKTTESIQTNPICYDFSCGYLELPWADGSRKTWAVDKNHAPPQYWPSSSTRNKSQLYLRRNPGVPRYI